MRGAGSRRKRYIIASAILPVAVGLVLANAIVVSRQGAEATGDSILPLDGGSIYVRQDGPRDAPALVLIHGLAGSTHWWDPLAPMPARSHRVIRIPVVGQLLWRFRTDKIVRQGLDTGFSRRGYKIPQQLVDDVRGMTFHALTATSRAVDDYLNQRALPDRLTVLGKPLLVIFGTEDRRWRSSSAAEYRAIPGARVELLPDVGHSPMLEDPPRTAAPLLTFTAIHAAQAD